MIGDQEIKVYVGPSDFGRDINIAIVLEGSGTMKAGKVMQGGVLEFTEEVAHGYHIPITLRLPRHLAEQLLAGLLEQNVKSPSAGAIEGELKATKLHLEDMRRLVKIPKLL